MSNAAAAVLSLRQRALTAGSWTLAGYALNQGLRLAGNLALTRLLFPEAFGLMAIVQTVIVGVTMISDVGLAPCIVQNKRGDDPAFLNTAWTMQVARGVLLWAVLWLAAGPIASIYGQPLLAALLPAAGLTALISGLDSTKLATADRRLQAARVTMIEFGSYALGLSITVVWAWLAHTVWALVWGGVVGAILKALASHFLLDGVRNRFHWNRDSAKTLFGFGQWIFVSSLITFLAGEGNKLLIAGMLTIDQVAFYSLASAISLMFTQAGRQVAGRVLFPSYAEIVRDRPGRLSAVLEKGRLVLILPAWLVAVAFVFVGDDVMRLLYDPRYVQSGRMLELLALGSLAGAMSLSYAGVLLAKGMVGTSALLQAVQVVVQVVAMIVGNRLYGVDGLVAGLAVANWIAYFTVAAVFARMSLWHPRVDVPFLCASAIVVAFATLA
jgi:O-antigen/teichoic acid export membrane protein